MMNDEKALTARITDYLANGGLFNPESMEHEKVRDLLIDCRDALAAVPSPAPVAVKALQWEKGYAFWDEVGALYHITRHQVLKTWKLHTSGVPDGPIETFPTEDAAKAAGNAHRLDVIRSALVDPVDIDAMVRRFLTWKLPADFNPDAGISFTRDYNQGRSKHKPVGTNLFTFEQAKAMVLHMLAGEQA